jgi:hypothetical protein
LLCWKQNLSITKSGSTALNGGPVLTVRAHCFPAFVTPLQRVLLLSPESDAAEIEHGGMEAERVRLGRAVGFGAEYAEIEVDICGDERSAVRPGEAERGLGWGRDGGGGTPSNDCGLAWVSRRLGEKACCMVMEWCGIGMVGGFGSGPGLGYWRPAPGAEKAEAVLGPDAYRPGCVLRLESIPGRAMYVGSNPPTNAAVVLRDSGWLARVERVSVSKARAMSSHRVLGALAGGRGGWDAWW